MTVFRGEYVVMGARMVLPANSCTSPDGENLLGTAGGYSDSFGAAVVKSEQY